MKEFKVIIPEERYLLLEFQQDELPGVAIFNAALVDFEPREVFGYLLTLTLYFEDLMEQGMPSEVEQMVCDKFEDELNLHIKGPDGEKPNALYLGRTTWNATRELFWRVFDPEAVHHHLQELIHLDNNPREFEYEMAHDPEWLESKWLLDACRQRDPK